MNKLSVKEKHIYVTQGLQRQGAFRKDKQYPQAIDLALTKAQDIIIKARLVPKKDFNQNPTDAFEVNQKYASDINTLIKFDQQLETFYDSVMGRSYGVLPYDFSYLLADKSYVVEDCQSSFKNATEDKTERVISIPFVNGAGPSYFVSTVVNFAALNRTVTTSGYSTTDERVYVVDYILDAFKEMGAKAYWENYKGIYKSQCFLIATTNLAITALITVDGVVSTPTNIDTAVKTFKTTIIDGTLALNRDIKSDFIDSANSSFYHKPSPISPLAALQENQILVYNSKRFLVSRIYASFIRKPKRISLALNQGSELHPSTHGEICDVAIAILKKQIESESYQIERADIKERIINN